MACSTYFMNDAIPESDRPSVVPSTIPIIGEFIKKRLEAICATSQEIALKPPTATVFIGLQGPQGSGKSYLASLLPKYCKTHYSLRVAVMSIDDFYLPHDELKSFSAAHSDNPFLQGRGLPGTHDVPLLMATLQKLKERNGIVHTPLYDKAAYSGQGDRDHRMTQSIDSAELDVIILEGWCVGFYSSTSLELSKKWISMSQKDREIYPYHAILELNTLLAHYDAVWDHLAAYIQLAPSEVHSDTSLFQTIVKWRTEQEQELRLKGRGGMTDSEIEVFVQRYMPGYLFFEGKQRMKWRTSGISLMLGQERRLLAIEEF